MQPVTGTLTDDRFGEPTVSYENDPDRPVVRASPAPCIFPAAGVVSTGRHRNKSEGPIRRAAAQPP